MKILNENYDPEKEYESNWENGRPIPLWDDGTQNTINSNGSKIWKNQNRLIHRDNDKPAFIGQRELKWLQNGQLHRDNDKPAVIQHAIQNDYLKLWYKNGQQYWPIHSLMKAIKSYKNRKHLIDSYLRIIKDQDIIDLLNIVNILFEQNIDFDIINNKLNESIISKIKKIVSDNLDLISIFKHIPEIREEFSGHASLDDLGI